jgi:WD40 repeat protein
MQQTKQLRSIKQRRNDWVSCMDVAASGEYIVCGGGSKFLSLWHLQSASVTATLPTASTPQDVCFTSNNTIMSVGNDPCVYHWNQTTGQMLARLKTSSASSLFSITAAPRTGLAYATGNSRNIEVLSAALLPSFSLQFY